MDAISPNAFCRELNLRYRASVSAGMLLRGIALSKVPARMNDRGTRWVLSLADIDVAAENLGLTQSQAAA
jgi:hypothetical protein